MHRVYEATLGGCTFYYYRAPGVPPENNTDTLYREFPDEDKELAIALNYYLNNRLNMRG